MGFRPRALGIRDVIDAEGSEWIPLAAIVVCATAGCTLLATGGGRCHWIGPARNQLVLSVVCPGHASSSVPGRNEREHRTRHAKRGALQCPLCNRDSCPSGNVQNETRWALSSGGSCVYPLPLLPDVLMPLSETRLAARWPCRSVPTSTAATCAWACCLGASGESYKRRGSWSPIATVIAFSFSATVPKPKLSSTPPTP